MRTPDGQNKELIQSALQLLKDPEEAVWRIEVRPESVAMVDYDKMRQERGEFIQSVSTFMQSAAPLVQMDPNATPTLIELLKWAVAGFKGSREIEGTLDRAIEAMQKAQEQEQQQDEGPSEAELEMQRSQQEHQQDMELQATKHQQSMDEMQAKHQADMKEAQVEFQMELKKIQAEMLAAIQEEIAQGQAAMVQDDRETANTMKIDDNKPRPGGDNGA
jgi:glutamyl/glutaminyl-tRNA synthetase